MPLAHVVKSIRAAAATRARQARSVARPIDRVILGFEWHGYSSRRAALSSGYWKLTVIPPRLIEPGSLPMANFISL